MKTEQHPDVNQIERDRLRYMKAHAFLHELYLTEGLTKQQKSTLRGQALAGDLPGARKGLDKLLGRLYDTD